jgi:hypothetical protein
MSGRLAFVLIAVGTPLYFLPSVVAYNRNHKDFAGVLIVNLLLGWTVVGWVVALAWATRPDSARPAPREGDDGYRTW